MHRCVWWRSRCTELSSSASMCIANMAFFPLGLCSVPRLGFFLFVSSCSVSCSRIDSSSSQSSSEAAELGR